MWMWIGMLRRLLIGRRGGRELWRLVGRSRSSGDDEDGLGMMRRIRFGLILDTHFEGCGEGLDFFMDDSGWVIVIRDWGGSGSISGCGGLLLLLLFLACFMASLKFIFLGFWLSNGWCVPLLTLCLHHHRHHHNQPHQMLGGLLGIGIWIG
jgi:hypothetical protein